LVDMSVIDQSAETFNSSFMTAIVHEPVNVDEDPALCSSTSAIQSNAAEKRSFTCQECGKAFNSVWYLKQHAVKHSKDRPFTCSYCLRTYRFRSNLYQHKCPQRDLVTSQTPKTGRSRKKTNHDKRGEASESQTATCINALGSGPLPPLAGLATPGCTTKGRSSIDVGVRDVYHRGGVSLPPLSAFQPLFDANPVKTERPRSGEMFECDRCFMLFPSREFLTRHMSWHNTEERKIQCVHCSEVFTTDLLYNMHKQSHSPTAADRCLYCNGKFCHRLALKRHLRKCGPHRQQPKSPSSSSSSSSSGCSSLPQSVGSIHLGADKSSPPPSSVVEYDLNSISSSATLSHGSMADVTVEQQQQQQQQQVLSLTSTDKPNIKTEIDYANPAVLPSYMSGNSCGFLSSQQDCAPYMKQQLSPMTNYQPLPGFTSCSVPNWTAGDDSGYYSSSSVSFQSIPDGSWPSPEQQAYTSENSSNSVYFQEEQKFWTVANSDGSCTVVDPVYGRGSFSINTAQQRCIEESDQQRQQQQQQQQQQMDNGSSYQNRDAATFDFFNVDTLPLSFYGGDLADMDVDGSYADPASLSACLPMLDADLSGFGQDLDLLEPFPDAEDLFKLADSSLRPEQPLQQQQQQQQQPQQELIAQGPTNESSTPSTATTASVACDVCLMSFQSLQALHSHFLSEHLLDNGSTSSTVCASLSNACSVNFEIFECKKQLQARNADPLTDEQSKRCSMETGQNQNSALLGRAVVANVGSSADCVTFPSLEMAVIVPLSGSKPNSHYVSSDSVVSDCLSTADFSYFHHSDINMNSVVGRKLASVNQNTNANTITSITAAINTCGNSSSIGCGGSGSGSSSTSNSNSNSAGSNSNNTSVTTKFACRFCPKLFLAKRYLRKHELTLHGADSVQLPPVEEAQDSSHNLGKLVKCPLCPKLFTTLKQLKQHVSFHARATTVQTSLSN
ncbi:Zinc finger imprinted 3, partial [Trichinella papuae]